MADNKKSLYEILGVSPGATLVEIKAAHRRRSLEIMSGKLGLGREDCDHQLQLLDVARNTLSDAASRALYDRQQAAATPNAAYPLATRSAPESEIHAMQVANAMAEMHRDRLDGSRPVPLDLGGVSRTLGATGRSLKIILRIAIWSLVLLATVRIGQNVLAKRQAALPPPPSVIARAEEKLIIQEYFKRTGVRLGSRAEVEAIEAERRRAEASAREAEFDERRQQEDSERMLEDSRRVAAHLEAEEARAEEAARQAARRREYEARAPRTELP